VSGWLLPSEALVAALIATALVIIGATFARRRTIARGEPLVVCAVRDPGAGRWRVGLARYGATGLDWFTLGGLSLRPSRHWQRTLLEIGPPRRLAPEDQLDVLPDAVAVACRCDDLMFDLALSPGPYTALRSWLEASPPGFNVNVA